MVRLAFAVQAQIDPDVLIVDEALAVGDAKFQAKCFARLRQLKNNGTSILFVSHATEQIITHCDKAILLNDGVIVDNGVPKKIINQYLDLLFGKSSPSNKDRKNEDEHVELASEQEKKQSDMFSERGNPILSLKAGGFEGRRNYNENEYRWGDRKAELLDFHLAQGDKEYPVTVNEFDNLIFHFLVRFNEIVFKPIFGFAIKTKDGITIYNTNSKILELPLIEVADPNETYRIKVEIPTKLFQGDYFVSIGIASYDTSGEVIPHDRRYDSIHITVEPTPQFLGLVNLEANISCDK